ncbi:MAG: MFS transporter [Chloroflexi bacterium]|nr:MFS transporter [Chloroflexota bacterium]
MKRLDAYTTYLILNGWDGLISSLIFTVNMIYQATVVGLNPLQLVLVGTVLEATAFICEVPTGVVADVYSRKLSIIIGYGMIGIGFLVEGLFPFFGAVLLAQVIWGAGWTFTSGATEAWLTDEIGEANIGRAFLRSSQVARFGTLVGIGASVFIGNERVNLPIIFGGMGFIALGIFLSLFMPETGFHPTPRENRNSFQHMWHTFREGVAMVRKRPALSTILGVGLFHGLYSEGVDRLWTPFLLAFAIPNIDGLTTVTWFGIIRIGAILLGIGANEIAHRRVKTDDEAAIRNTLFAINIGMVAALFVFGLAPDFYVAVGAYWVWSMLRQTHNPLHTTWVNIRLDPHVRATVNSMTSQVDALGQVIAGPIVGAIGTAISLRAALLSSAAILSPVLALFARTAAIADSRPQTVID